MLNEEIRTFELRHRKLQENPTKLYGLSWGHFSDNLKVELHSVKTFVKNKDVRRGVAVLQYQKYHRWHGKIQQFLCWTFPTYQFILCYEIETAQKNRHAS